MTAEAEGNDRKYGRGLWRAEGKLHGSRRRFDERQNAPDERRSVLCYSPGGATDISIRRTLATGI